MKASITGGTGFIGSHLIDALLARGYDVACLIRKSSNLRWLKGKQIRFVEGDLFDDRTLKELVTGADQVYHLAGVVKSKSEEGYIHANVDATRKLLAACTEHAPDLKKFIHVSSQTAVGPSKDLTHPVTEETPCVPITGYGRSKRAGEELVLSYRERLPVTIVRPPAVYGPRDTEIFIFFQTIRRGLNPMIGFDDKRLSLIHSADLVSGLLLAAESPESAGEIYFISSEEFYGWAETGKLAAHLMGRKNPLQIRIPHAAVYGIAGIAQFLSMFRKAAATLNLEKARDLTRAYWTCDVSKAKRELGYRQAVPLEDGFRDTIEWYRAEGWLS